MFTILVDKPEDMIAALAKLNDEVAKAGGQVRGDAEAGEFEAQGVRGRYIVGETEIEIVIQESRFPQMMIEPYIKEMFRAIMR